MRKIQLIITIISLLFAGSVNAESGWQVEGTQTTITMTIEGKKGPVYVTCLINFNPETNCFPEIGLLIVTEKKLGKFIVHRLAKDSMSIYIDSKKPWKERTALAKYSNGFEATIIGNDRIIEEIETGNEVFMSPFPGYTHFAFPLNGASATIEKAKSYCR